jgi:hypothetical protein
MKFMFIYVFVNCRLDSRSFDMPIIPIIGRHITHLCVISVSINFTNGCLLGNCMCYSVAKA